MASIITRGGKGAAITESENDDNLKSLCGISEAKVGAYEIVAANQNSIIECSNASTTIITLDLILDILTAIDTPDFKVAIKNIGAGNIIVTPTTDTFDDGSATKILAQYEWITIQTDSTQALWNVVASSDASKVDGLDASQFLRSDINDTTTGTITSSSSTPKHNFFETDATVNNRLWRMYVSAETFNLDISNDAESTGNSFLNVTRTAQVIDKVTIKGTDVDIAGTLQINSVDVPGAPTTIGTVGISEMVSSDSNGNVNFPDGKAIGDANGNEAIIIGTTASANAQVTITNGVDKAVIAATGDNADADLNISAKGAGALTLDGYWHSELAGNGTQGRLLTSSSDTTNWTTVTDSAMAIAGATLAHIRVANSVAANAAATERVRTVYVSNYVASFIGTAGVSGNMVPASTVRAYYYSVSHSGPVDTAYTDVLVPVDSSGRFMWFVSTAFSPGGSAGVTLEGYYT